MKTTTRRPSTNANCSSELEGLLRAASVCGCATCRHAARARAIKEQADDVFTRALADLAAAMGLPWLIRRVVEK